MNGTSPGTSRAAYAKGPEKFIPRTISLCLQALLSSEQQLWKEGKEEIQRRREQIPTSYHLRDRNSKKCVAERAFPQGASPFQGLWCGKLPHEPSTPSGWFHVHLEPVKLLLLLGWGIKPALQTASQCCREDLLEMRTPLVTLLAAVLCVEQGEPLLLLLLKTRMWGKMVTVFHVAELWRAVTILAVLRWCHQCPFAPQSIICCRNENLMS